MGTNTKQFSLAQLQNQSEHQIRACLNEAAVAEYVDAMQAEDKFPPIKVVKHNDTFILADGFHRVAAARQLGKTSILAEIIEGDEGKVLEIAIASNSKHGLRLTAADKRRAITAVLRQWPKLSDREIARMVGVSPPTVADERKRQSLDAPVRTGGDGKERHLPDRSTKVPLRKATLPPRRKSNPHDETGIEVPNETLELWHRAKDVAMDKVRQLQFFVTHLEEMRDSNDIIYTEVQQAFEMNIAKVKAVVADLKQAIPYAVCHTCNGKTPKDCATCSGRGYVSKHYYKTYVPSEVKKLRGEGEGE